MAELQQVPAHLLCEGVSAKRITSTKSCQSSTHMTLSGLAAVRVRLQMHHALSRTFLSRLMVNR